MYWQFSNIIITVILLPFFQGYKTNDDHQSRPQTKPTTIQVKRDERDTSQWKTYTNHAGGYLFQYPGELILSARKNQIVLSHSIRFRHLDPCDYSGSAKQLNKLADLKISITTVNEAYPGKNPFPADDKITIGSLIGEYLCSCVEGCGEYIYRFPAGKNKTLIVKRGIIGMFSQTAQRFGDEESALKQKGLISPEKEQLYFEAILKTIRFKK